MTSAAVESHSNGVVDPRHRRHDRRSQLDLSHLGHTELFTMPIKLQPQPGAAGPRGRESRRYSGM